MTLLGLKRDEEEAKNSKLSNKSKFHQSKYIITIPLEALSFCSI